MPSRWLARHVIRFMLTSGASWPSLPTVTELEFHTDEDGTVRWTRFEDEDDVVRRMKIADIPPHIPRIDAAEASYVCDLVATGSVASYKGELFALNPRNYPSQNDEFPPEVNTLIQLSNFPQAVAVQLSGVVVEVSPSDLQLYVQGILLPYCEKGDAKTLLKNALPPGRRIKKGPMAAQIAHAMTAIRKMGLMHRDLKCGNVVVDKCDDAFLIDITNGDPFTEGPTPIGDRRMDQRMYTVLELRFGK